MDFFTARARAATNDRKVSGSPAPFADGIAWLGALGGLVETFMRERRLAAVQWCEKERDSLGNNERERARRKPQAAAITHSVMASHQSSGRKDSEQ